MELQNSECFGSVVRLLHVGVPVHLKTLGVGHNVVLVVKTVVAYVVAESRD